MKIASVTVIWNDEKFIRPHFKMISRFDFNVVLLGKRPFIDYRANGLVEDRPDGGEAILRAEFPHVHIISHDSDYFCGDLFNIGMEKARELGADAIVKLDPDMMISDRDWDSFVSQIRDNDDWDVLLLDYANNTIAYKKDFDHGVPARIFPIGMDPHVVRIDQKFIQDGVRIAATGRQRVLKDIMVHHFTGFRPCVDDVELKRVEGLPGFEGWTRCPEEITNKFK
jgi:hypothetical protein